jgi:uncharacterized protein (TIGR02145 family)
MKKFLFSVCAVLAILSCGDDDEYKGSAGYTGSYGSVEYGTQTYKTVKIGAQTWFAENLNYDVEGSRCYDNLESNCAKYGRLYDWSAAMAVCPPGWHLPDNDDWDELFRYVDSQNNGDGSSGNPYDSFTAGRYLKAMSGWNDNEGQSVGGNGTDDYGFSALPGGDGHSDGSFSSIGYFGGWWSASESNGYACYRVMVFSLEYAYHSCYNKPDLFSVRCFQG